MTEDEAKTKWCPVARVALPNGSACNRDFETPNLQESHPSFIAATRCIGSACMAWQYDLTREEASNGYPAASGHCGLTGKP